MKRLLYLLPLIAFCIACKQTLDPKLATKPVEMLFDDITKGDFSNLKEIYASQYNSEEQLATRTVKLNEIRQELGEVESFELVETKQAENADGVHLAMQYRVKHKRITTLETYIVIKDEGDYRIAQQDITVPQ